MRCCTDKNLYNVLIIILEKKPPLINFAVNKIGVQRLHGERERERERERGRERAREGERVSE